MVDLGTVSLTGDEDGFLSRQCPSCRRVFKRPIAGIHAAQPPAPYCPYCGGANDGDWETAAQQAYYLAAMDRAAMKYVHEQFNASMKSVQSEFLKFTPGTPDLPPDPGSPPPDPSHGFVRVDVPCHEDDPFKVADGTHVDEDQDVEPLEEDGVDAEEVCGSQSLGVSRQELLPRQVRSATSRWNSSPLQDRPDRGRRYCVPELEQLAPDPEISPAGVLSGHSHDQLATPV